MVIDKKAFLKTNFWPEINPCRKICCCKSSLTTHLKFESLEPSTQGIYVLWKQQGQGVDDPVLEDNDVSSVLIMFLSFITCWCFSYIQILFCQPIFQERSCCHYMRLIVHSVSFSGCNPHLLWLVWRLSAILVSCSFDSRFSYISIRWFYPDSKHCSR